MLPWCSSGTNGIGGQPMTFAIVLSSSGAAAAAAMKPATTSGVAGRTRIPPTTPLEGMEREREAGDDAEVAAAAANRPEQVRVRIGVDLESLAVGGDDLDAQQRVDGHAVLAHEIADPAAERDPADAHRPGVTEADGQAVLGCRRRDLGRGEAGLGSRDARLRIDLDALHLAKVDHDAAVGGAESEPRVAATANRQLEVRLAGEADDGRHVVDVMWTGDQEWPVVEPSRSHDADIVVRRMFGRDDRPVDALAQLGD